MDTRQGQLDDLMNKISQCRASIEKTQVSFFSFGSLVAYIIGVYSTKCVGKGWCGFFFGNSRQNKEFGVGNALFT